MKTNKKHEEKREQFDETCEANYGMIASASELIDALKAANAEKDKLMNHLVKKIDDLQAQINSTSNEKGFQKCFQK